MRRPRSSCKETSQPQAWFSTGAAALWRRGRYHRQERRGRGARRQDLPVDGVVGAEIGLPGKTDPAMCLEAARRLGVDGAGPMGRCSAIPAGTSACTCNGTSVRW